MEWGCADQLCHLITVDKWYCDPLKGYTSTYPGQCPQRKEWHLRHFGTPGIVLKHYVKYVVWVIVWRCGQYLHCGGACFWVLVCSTGVVVTHHIKKGRIQKFNSHRGFGLFTFEWDNKCKFTFYCDLLISMFDHFIHLC